MGRIDRDNAGNLSVSIENESDAAQLRATIKASDWAAQIAATRQTMILSADNPFNPTCYGSWPFMRFMDARCSSG